MFSYLTHTAKIYQRQQPALLIFSLIFCLLNFHFTTAYGIALCYTIATLSMLVAAGKEVSFMPILHFRFAVLLLLIILQCVFSAFIGNKPPMWILSSVFIFQTIFLFNSRNHQYILIFAILVGVIVSGMLQHNNPSYIFGRIVLLLAFSFLIIKTITVLVNALREVEKKTQDNLLVTNELHKAKAFQRQLLDSTGYAIIATNLDGVIIEFNKGAEIMLGYSSEEILDKHTPMLFHDAPEVEERTTEINLRYDAGITPGFITFIYKNKIGLQNSAEWTYIHKSGKRFKVLLSITTLRNTQGQTIGYLGTAQDITEKKAAEEKQHTAETIIANSPSVLFKWLPNDSWTVKYVSANVKHVLGYSSLDFSTNQVKYVHLIHPDDLEIILTITNETLEKDLDKMTLEYRLKHRDGHYIWVMEQTYVMRNAQQEVSFFEGVITDISRRKVAEEQLKESELRYELAVQGTSAGIWDWLDVNGKEQWWSARFYELLGYDFNEIPASVDTFRTFLHPDDRELLLEKVDRHFKQNTPFLIEYRFKTKSGKYKWFLGSGQLYRDAEGNPKRMVGSVIDIDFKKKNEELLAKSEERFRLLIEAASDVFYNTDHVGRFTYCNDVAATVTGYDKDELLTMRYIDLIRHDYKSNAAKFYVNQLKSKTERTYFEFPILTKTGETRWIGQNVQIIYTNGQFKGIQAVAREITDLKNTQLKLQEHAVDLERINKELDQFAYVVSHDLKSPLRGISNLTEWIKEEMEPHLTAETIKNFDLLKSRVFRLEQFINGLLQYSRAGRKVITTKMVNTIQLVDSVLEFAQVPNHVKIEKNIENLNFKTDVISLEQVLNNLISNAIKYNISEHPYVFIGCQKQRNSLLFTIKDNGMGIEPQYHNKIFQIFQTLESRDNYESTGIGLAIVKKILDEKNGTIQVKSTLGEGSTFEFNWPLINN
jgi:PAS domain S-box-containing protein